MHLREHFFFRRSELAQLAAALQLALHFEAQPLCTLFTACIKRSRERGTAYNQAVKDQPASFNA
jgi:hypothetical protein